ncbi:hypothetical protein [Celeribacter ethanolicus]|uniref:hypothetical protein n=1 Tax=Celeribacter ethanolicus TaxID=1758178 RepID=UPI000ACF4018|nr:hypothetical protein [Celeribacter ethanolicus]
MPDRFFGILNASLYLGCTFICYLGFKDAWEVSPYILVPTSMFAGFLYMLFGTGITIGFVKSLLTFGGIFQSTVLDVTAYILGFLIFYAFNVAGATIQLSKYIQ